MLIYLMISLSVFICMNLYYIFNREKLNTRIKFNLNKEKSPILFTYYTLKVLFPIWVITGLFISKLFYILLFLIILKFAIFHLNKKSYLIYDKILPILYIIVMILILNIKFL